MKTVLSFILIAFFFYCNAQTDTLYANQTHNLAIFFQSPIRQALAGSGNFTFSYNRDKPQYFGLLQASPGPGSNLLVLTIDGNVYSFALHYRKELLQTNRFIELNESIGHENQTLTFRKPQVTKDSTIPNIPDKKYQTKKKKYFEDVCTSLLQKNTRNLKSKGKDGMHLGLQNVVYRNREVFLVFGVKNKSGIDFELEYLKVFKVNGNKKRKSSYQKIGLEPVYVQAYPVMVKNNTDKRFVYVLPKFTLGDSERLLFEFQEKRGSRNVQLVVDKIVL